MIYSLALTILAFAWLMYETKFLTIRLPYRVSLASQMIGNIIGICLTPTIEKIVDEIIEETIRADNNAGRKP